MQRKLDFKKAYDIVWWQVLYTILTESGITMKLGRVMKPLGESGWASICLTSFLLRMV